jgi:hypothetical protein
VSEAEPDIGAEARSIIERLERVDPAAPTDRARIEAALVAAHRAVDVEPVPQRWVDDADAFFSAAWAAGREANKAAGFLRSARTPWASAVGKLEKPANKKIENLKPEYLKSMRLAQTAAAEATKKSAAREEARAAALRAMASLTWTERAGVQMGEVSWSAWPLGFLAILTGLRSKDEAAEWHADAFAAARNAQLAAAWSAMAASIKAAARNPKLEWWTKKAGPLVDKMPPVLAPFVDAYEAGLWLYCLTPTEAITAARSAGEPFDPLRASPEAS